MYTRLKTKNDRLELQKYFIDSMIEKGYKMESYKDIKILTKIEESTYFFAYFRGTASKPVENIRTKEEKSFLKYVKDAKERTDRAEIRKQEIKNNPTVSTAANTAKAIREELKTNFQGIKFTVKSSNFSGGNSVSIRWNDGPTEKEVNSIVSKYQYGSFNGMEDIYEYTNSRDDIPQAKYVQTQRDISDEVNKITFDFVKNYFSENIDNYEINTYKNRLIYKISIPAGAILVGFEKIDENKNFGTFEDMYKAVFDLSNATQPEEKNAPNFERVEVEPGTVQIIDYSEKSFAIIGDTKPIKDTLKNLGGKFNFRLSCGAGWIFPKNKLEEVQTALS